ncbi:hypothetical protein JCM9492_00280 [Aquifex pyrophilus]
MTERKIQLLKRLFPNVNFSRMKPYEIDIFMDRNELHAERRLIERTNLPTTEMLRISITANHIATNTKKKTYVPVFKNNVPIG